MAVPLLPATVATACLRRDIARRCSASSVHAFRPIHIQALLLTASAPQLTPTSLFPRLALTGPASIPHRPWHLTAGKSSRRSPCRLSKRGLVLAHPRCPIEPGTDTSEPAHSLGHLPQASCPNPPVPEAQRVLVVSPELQPLAPQLRFRSGLPRFLYLFCHPVANCI